MTGVGATALTVLGAAVIALMQTKGVDAPPLETISAPLPGMEDTGSHSQLARDIVYLTPYLIMIITAITGMLKGIGFKDKDVA